MIKKIAYYVFIFIVSIILLINIFSIFNFSLFGFRMFKIASGSMSPTLVVNDVVLIKKSHTYHKNDIITFTLDNKEFITHRIVEINNNEVLTKGDFNNTIDKPINKDNIVGKVVYKFKVFKFLINIFSKTLFLILLVVTLVIIIFVPKSEENNKQEE